MATPVDPYAPIRNPVIDATAAADPSVAIMKAAAAEKARQLQAFQQKQALEAAQEQRTQASSALAQAHDQHVIAQDQQTQQTHALANDLGQWSQDPQNPQYRVPWDQAPEEVRQHVQQAFPDVASTAPKVWNDAYTANTGNVVVPHVPASGAHKIAAAQHGVEVLPTDTDDDIVQKISAKQAAEAAPPNNGAPGEEALAGMNPDEANMVRQIANYDLPATSLSRLPAAQKLRILGRVQQYDPTFTANEYPARQSLKTSVKAGPISENIKSANTVVSHLNVLLEKAKALNNKGFTPWNAVTNTTGKMFGYPEANNFENAANAVVGELAKVFKGSGVVPAAEIKHWRDGLSTNMSPDQVRGAVQTALELMGGRFEAIQGQYERGMGRPKDFAILQPKARAILRNNGFDPDSIEGGTPPPEVLPNSANGAPSAPAPAPGTQPQIPTVNSQQEYDQLPRGTQYRDSNGKTATKR